MNKARNTWIWVVIVLIIVGALVWYNRGASWLAPFLGSGTTSGQQQTGEASYACDASKTIVATYYTGPSQTAAVSSTTPPTPNGSVALVLSDGRTMTLPQTISGSGIRYANADESLVFWSEGNTAFITEGTGSNAPQTFANCVAVSTISGQESWNVFASSTLGYSIKYPTGFVVTTPYAYQELGPSKDIAGVKFTIDPAIATGTNLSRDSYVSVEQLPNDAANCNASLFLDQGASMSTVTDNGVDYSVASSTGAGAGNRYEEWVWAIPGSSACTAVRYFIHYGVIENYPAGTVAEFNHVALIKEFDNIRRSLVLAR